ncbi:MAG: DUF4968 domain-containing protein, partial [Bacteroidales bacterium]|nr:DUF4968 domain-containing protein [Bacteroidales bacterium]
MNERVSAYHSLSQSLGNLIRFARYQQSLLLETDRGRARVTVYSQGVIRIQASRQDFAETPSYSVVASPATTYYSIEEKSACYILKTNALQLSITKSPVRFDFLTLEGEVINQDDPGLGISWLGEEVGAYKTLQQEERFIGLGEKTGPLDRRGAAFVNWNTDNPNHQPGDDPLYVSIPFYIGIHNGLNYGIFFDNSHLTRFNFGASNNRFSSFTAEAGEMDYYFIFHKTVSNIIGTYTWLTGRMPMPPKWALGYQQCRWSYYPDSEILSIARTFREKNIPADVIYFDIDHMKDYKLFSWSGKNFPRPSETIGKLREMDFHSAVIVDPGVKIEKDYPLYESGVAEDVFIKYPDGSNYAAEVWPGWC